MAEISGRLVELAAELPNRADPVVMEFAMLKSKRLAAHTAADTALDEVAWSAKTAARVSAGVQSVAREVAAIAARCRAALSGLGAGSAPPLSGEEAAAF